MKRLLASVFGLSALLSASMAFAADFPTRPITMIVPFRAGGPTDTVGRTLSEAMGRALGQQVVIEVVDGAGGTLGAQRVASAEPDGYTILLNHIAMATTPSQYPNLPYDPLKSFAEIGLVTNVPMALITRQRVPANDIPSLLKYIGAHLDTFTMAHAGIGSASDLCAMLFKKETGLDITTVPYDGTAPAMLDLQGDFVDMMCDQTTSTVTNIQSGSVIGYMVTSPERLKQIPNVPTFTEVKLDGLELNVWHGLWAPAGTPPEVIATLNDAMKKALKDPKVLALFDRYATTVVPEDQQTPEALHAKVAAEIEHWKPIIEANGELVQ